MAKNLFFIIKSFFWFTGDENVVFDSSATPPSPTYLMKRRNALKPSILKFIDDETDDENVAVEPQQANPLPPPPQADDDYEEEETYETWQSKVKFWLRILMPHFALFCLAASYILLGAVYFHYHEGAFEVKSKTQHLSEFFAFRDEFYHKILILSNSNTSLVSRENFQKTQRQLFDDFVSHIFRIKNNQYITRNHLLDETQKGDNEQLWSFSNSVFFSTILLTTIGYTNLLAPATVYGRIGCAFYSFFGIPLILVTISDISKFQSEFILLSYRKWLKLKEKIIRAIRKPISQFLSINETELFPTRLELQPPVHVCDQCAHIRGASPQAIPEEDIRLPAAIMFSIFIAYFLFSGFILSIWKGWSFMDAIFICYTTMTTIGFGNELPSENDSKVLIIFCIFFGVAFTRMFYDMIGVQYIRKIHYYARKFNAAVNYFKKMFRSKSFKETAVDL